MNDSSRRGLPAVERVLQALAPLPVPRPAATALIRRELAALRAGEAPIPGVEAVIEQLRGSLDALASTRIRPVINATGILVHTNLGRSPLSAPAMAALAGAGANYTNLEYDLAAGKRGGRATYLEHNLAIVCSAQAATAVNNCAAALVLILRHFTRKKPEVIISRGELVEIGGGFRIPEILEASGARLREVGTTNRTTVEDYAAAIGSETALILRVHRANFYQEGFVASADPIQLATLAGRRRVPFVEDLGSGALTGTQWLANVEHERAPDEALASGADLVCFSGDKLMGGPQAGLIAGKAKMIAALKREPFYRALRCDKLILSALEATVDQYLSGEPDIPVLTMLAMGAEALRKRAERIAGGLPLEVRVGASLAAVGGGTLPRSMLESVTIDLRHPALPAAELAARLRGGAVPVIGYVSGDWCKLDLRTVFPSQDEMLAAAIRAVCEKSV